MLGVLVGILLFFLLAKPTTAKAPQQSNEDYSTNEITIKEGAIVKPYINPDRPTNSSSERRIAPNQINGRHSTRAEKQISENSLRTYLQNHSSPLVDYAAQLLRSPYFSTIIGICTIEQYGCTKAPYNNYWGIMCGRQICRYSNLNDGIEAIDNLLAKYEARGKDTIEELNGYYVVPASQNWYNTVLNTKLKLESLTLQ